MGLYDTFRSKDDKIEIQLKVGECLMRNFVEGEYVEPREFPDGVYHGYGGVVVIRRGIVEAVADTATEDNLPHFDKWGGEFDPGEETLDAHNPIVQALARSVRPK